MRCGVGDQTYHDFFVSAVEVVFVVALEVEVEVEVASVEDLVVVVAVPVVSLPPELQ